MRPVTLSALAALVLGAAPTPAATQSGPAIDEVVWPGIDSYCTFMVEGHGLVYDDPDTWRFLFFTGLPESDRDTIARAFMRIDGQLRELALVDRATAGTGEVWTFRTHDDPPYEVSVNAVPYETGTEYTSYTGTITVTREGASTSADFQGDCGV